MEPSRQPAPERTWCIVSCLLLAATVAQLAAGAFLQLQQFEGKAFGARLVLYPVGMLLLPTAWLAIGRLRGVPVRVPWAASACIMWAFFVDVTGNTLNLYDTIDDWDNINHFANWLVLTLGVGLCLARADVRPRWMLAVATVGAGSMLALGWEVAEWYTFIRHGTELDGAYEDTLSDEVLGTLGSLVAALLLLRITRGDASGADGDTDVQAML